MATHSSVLAWRISWTEEPCDYSPWGHKELDMAERLTLPLSTASKLVPPRIISLLFTSLEDILLIYCSALII